MMFKRYILSVSLALSMMQGSAQEVFVANAVSDDETPQIAWQLHTNGLYWLAAAPNIGMEIQTDWGISLSLDYIGAWWNKRPSDRFYSFYGFQSELRYYPDAIYNYAPYRGHHFGIYGQLLTYDFEFGGTGYQSAKFGKTWAAGLAYGYTKVLNRRLSLDFTIGIGYFQSKYDVYHPEGGWYKRDKTKKLTFFGRTKLEATLVWNINRFNDK